MEHVIPTLQSYFGRYGYWTIAVALLLENAGIPVPGETVLLVASAFAVTQHELRLPFIILVGIAAATCGDNIGYGLGRWGGRWLLDRYRSIFRVAPTTIARGERLFNRYGATAVFFARFIFGMRVIAGPLAGVLRMQWERFATFNALGAATWVVIVSLLGYTFGRHWPYLLELLRNVDIALAVVAAIGVAWLWWKLKRARS